MTRELARALDEEFAALTPPSDLSGTAIVQKGRTARRRRRGAFGGALAGVAVLVAGALLSGLLPLGGTTPPPPGEIAQPDYPLPAMDPDAGYVWHRSGGVDQVTDATAAIDEAWRAAFTAAAAETGAELYVNIDDSAPTGAEWVPFSEAEYRRVVRRENALFRIVGGTTWNPELEATGYVIPYFWAGDLALSRGPGQQADRLSVQVLPKGSFHPGAGQPLGAPVEPSAPYAVAGCEDYTYRLEPGSSPFEVDYTCTDGAGPGGERVLAVETVIANETSAFHRELTVVLYRLDGTAVVVEDSFVSFDAHRPGSLPDATALDAARLLDIALAMPGVPVA
ncbi:hypothetical protein [Phytomonospora endophytica]|uniref:Uncharacterized protein n=1 Tax=Phytomonospora endophytica TaxID=714109 RepID=A0A841FJJ4_9ACTN|nr:hypothetical protein [Phytomonospora endophytica]MBB6036356.1 hypothetical protein [Phytomonospora endophytica]GIG67263.1 hypothetical protein Pen01_35580 [Phytomonospora endophytica]